MGNSRSIRRSIARHPVNVWRAKKKSKQQEAEKAGNQSAFEITPDEISKIKQLPDGLTTYGPQ